MKKLCWIKSDKGEKRCPFGLPITEGCKCAGSSVLHMCPLESIYDDKKQLVEKANKRVYIYYKTNCRCIYAVNIMENENTVNCDQDDVAAGMQMKAIEGSPIYAQSFGGIGLDGLYAFPLGFYADNNESRNLFQGLFSLVGSAENVIIKESECKEDEEEELTQEEIVELCNKWNPPRGR